MLQRPETFDCLPRILGVGDAAGWEQEGGKNEKSSGNVESVALIVAVDLWAYACLLNCSQVLLNNSSMLRNLLISFLCDSYKIY